MDGPTWIPKKLRHLEPPEHVGVTNSNLMVKSMSLNTAGYQPTEKDRSDKSHEKKESILSRLKKTIAIKIWNEQKSRDLIDISI